MAKEAKKGKSGNGIKNSPTQRGSHSNNILLHPFTTFYIFLKPFSSSLSFCHFHPYLFHPFHSYPLCSIKIVISRAVRCCHVPCRGMPLNPTRSHTLAPSAPARRASSGSQRRPCSKRCSSCILSLSQKGTEIGRKHLSLSLSLSKKTKAMPSFYDLSPLRSGMSYF